MHIEAMQRIKNKLCKLARKGVDPIAYCGFSCNHCFLGEWCGGCRSVFSCCSYGTFHESGNCPNIVCCNEKKIDGCYECNELADCTKGFYKPDNDGAFACKAQALFIKKYGKDILEEINEYFGNKGSYYQKNYNGICYDLSFSTLPSIEIMKKFYEIDTPCLIRKKEKFNDYLNLRIEMTSKS